MTIKDIARIAGVSVSTVSRVINNENKGVAGETREKVLKVIQKNDYCPNAYAQYLGRRNNVKTNLKTGTVSRRIEVSA